MDRKQYILAAVAAAALAALTVFVFSLSDSGEKSKDASKTSQLSSSPTPPGSEGSSPSGSNGNGSTGGTGSPGATLAPGATATPNGGNGGGTGGGSDGSTGAGGSTGGSGGSGGSTGSGGKLTKSEFVTQASALCTQTQKDITPKVGTATSSGASAATMENMVTKIGVMYDSAIALAQSAVEKSTVMASWLTPAKADYDARAPILREVIAATKTENQGAAIAAITKMNKVTSHAAAINKFLKSYGLESCAPLTSAIG